MQLFVRELEADELLVDTVSADDTEGEADIGWCICEEPCAFWSRSGSK